MKSYLEEKDEKFDKLISKNYTCKNFENGQLSAPAGNTTVHYPISLQG